MSKKSLVQITTDEKGREIVMVRADKTLGELMEEKPTSRWDSKYWHPQYEELEKFIRSLQCDVINLGEIIEMMTNGNRDRKWASFKDEKVRFIQVVNVLNTGIDFEAGDSKKHYAKKNGLGDPERSRLKQGDIVLLSGATGSLGRATMITDLKQQTNISQDINLIRLKNDNKIKPAYFIIYLLSDFGKKQIVRHSKGVSGQIKITFDQIESMLIPILQATVQSSIESEYKKMSKYHGKAMEAKKKNDNTEYKKNIENAEKMLNVLISKTEAVIRDERKDVI